MSQESPCYLVDATIYAFRAWFSIPDSVRDREGRPFNVVHGFAGFIAELLKQARPTSLAFCFDESLTTSFRNDIDPRYKANRESAPEDLKAQLQACRALCRAIGALEMADPRHEADDLIGSLLQKAANRPAVIVTRDKDLAQLLRRETGDRLWDFAGDRWRGVADIEAEYGVRPEQFADYLALVGDTVDNIEGVKGIGPKAASTLLQKYENLECLYAELESLAGSGLRGAARWQTLLREGREAAFLARRLTGIVCDLPMDGVSLDWTPPPHGAAMAALQDIGLGERSARRIADSLPEALAR